MVSLEVAVSGPRVQELEVLSRGPGAPPGEGQGPDVEWGGVSGTETRMWGRRAVLTRAGQPG